MYDFYEICVLWEYIDRHQMEFVVAVVTFLNLPQSSYLQIAQIKLKPHNLYEIQTKEKNDHILAAGLSLVRLKDNAEEQRTCR